MRVRTHRNHTGVAGLSEGVVETERESEVPEVVRGELELPALLRAVQRRQRHDPGVVDEHVEGAGPGAGERVDGAAVEEVELGDTDVPGSGLLSEGGGCLLAGLDVADRDRHIRALRSERPRGLGTDTRPAAGDDDALAGQVDAFEHLIVGGLTVGTVYRHFPTREALIEAAYRSELDAVCDAAPELVRTLPAEQALRTWMDRFVDYMTTKIGMSDAIRAVISSGANPYAHSRERLDSALEVLFEATTKAGVTRSGVNVDDVLMILSGIAMAAGEPAQREQAGRMLDLLLDGVRYGA